jgi:A/G-specific adenine glycosylase
MHEPADGFAQRLLAWFDRHGRHDLPWQRARTPYSVWVSEIMLQQTQVATVIPYYERFMQRFPTLDALAAATLDDVLAHWAGLGYYARARNMHRAARVVAERFAGKLPATLDDLEALPGIGRSTAAAILAQAHGRRAAILDGNAKRVLARYHMVAGWTGDSAVQRELWTHAEAHTPHARVAAYTQAIMDLGATLCTRSRPACTVCPLALDCRACREGTQAKYPAARPRRARPQRRSAVLVVQDPDGYVLLERRPEHGIWGGLYCLPELGAGETAGEWLSRELGARLAASRRLAPIAHSFTHFDLDLEPLLVTLDAQPAAVMDRPDRVWYNASAEPAIGMPAPVAALLAALAESTAALHEDERRIA